MTAVAKLESALRGCVEHMEHSTPQGRAAYEQALAALSPAELGGVEDAELAEVIADLRELAEVDGWICCGVAADLLESRTTPRAAEAVTEYRWRSVSDDLPERTGWYIGINYGVVEPLRWDGNNWHHTRVTRDLAMPSHWRPLPAPPSAKGE